MLFSSNEFLFAFLPLVLLVYYIAPRAVRNPVLLAVSLFFYGWGEPVYLFLMMATILINYLCGRWIEKVRTAGKSGKTALVWGVVANLAILGYFKYAGFLMNQLKLIPFLKHIAVPDIALPIGISFYVFQSMSYIIDVYRNDAPVQNNVLTFGTYVTLFPQLIAGPIVRYSDVALQMDERRENMSQFADGVLLFVCGLGKKILLANQMGALWNLLQGHNGMLSGWIGILAYTLQIYFDFSGYSDMALGLGKMVGFEFLINFNYPYISDSITEFWRRWHMSLSTWFKEYVYIPLGGNRKGKVRQIVNLLVVWMLTGLWHGASWNFVLWGLYYAILLICEKLFMLRALEKLPRLLRHMYAMVIVMLGWALFYFEDLGALFAFLGRLVCFGSDSAEGIHIMLAYLPTLAVSCVAALPFVKQATDKYADTAVIRYGRILGAGAVLMLCAASLASQSYNPFIYFRF